MDRLLRPLQLEVLEGPRGESFLRFELAQRLLGEESAGRESGRLAKLAREAYIDRCSGELFVDLRRLYDESQLIVREPLASDLDAFDLASSPLSEEGKSALIQVEVAPIRLVAKILRSIDDVYSLTPRQFEQFVADTLHELGFQEIILTPASRDGGKDVIASQVVNGIAVSFYFECKKYAAGHKVQLDRLRSLLGVVAHDARGVNKGVLVTTSTFTAGCRDFLMQEKRLDGKDYHGIMAWLDEIRKKSHRII